MKCLTAILLCLLLAMPAWAGWEEGAEAYGRGDYATALREWRPLAEQGNGEAQYWIGFLYDQGKGVPKDHDEAIKWYREAAKRGDALAQITLGNVYYTGKNVPQDYAEAAKWYRGLADKGDANAQYYLGRVLSLSQKYIRAHKWYNLAASHGDKRIRKLAREGRHKIAQKMSGTEITKAHLLARRWWEAFKKRKR